MSKSNYLESKVLRHIIGAASFSMPTTLYLALYSSDPGETDSGTEISGGSPAYARKPITWGTEANGEVSNSVAVSINPPTATVTHWGIRDALTGGNLMYKGAFDAPISTASGTPLSIAVGDIVIAER